MQTRSRSVSDCFWRKESRSAVTELSCGVECYEKLCQMKQVITNLLFECRNQLLRLPVLRRRCVLTRIFNKTKVCTKFEQTSS